MHTTVLPNSLFTDLILLELCLSRRQIILTIPKKNLQLYYHLPITSCIITPQNDFYYKDSCSAPWKLYEYVCASTIALGEPYMHIL